jgi:hypothetical protein
MRISILHIHHDVVLCLKEMHDACTCKGANTMECNGFFRRVLRYGGFFFLIVDVGWVLCGGGMMIQV